MTPTPLYPCLAPLRGKGPSAYTVTRGPLDTPCWLWNGCANSKGYPVRGTQHGRYLVHRQVFCEAGSTLADGEQAHHLCETRLCVNPSHLSARSPLAHAREHAGNLTAAERACTVLADGPADVRTLADLLGLRLPSLRVALWRAQLRGEVIRLGDGRWAVTANDERKVA